MTALETVLPAVTGAFLASFLSLPLWRGWCRKVGLVDDPGHRKLHASPVPLAGGLAILTGLALPLAAMSLMVALDFPAGETIAAFTHDSGLSATQWLASAAGLAGMTLLGALDDRYELSAVWKFAGQMLAALPAASLGARISIPGLDPLVAQAVTLIWILAVTNAFNFTDNMNGLCAGLAVIAGALTGILALLHGRHAVAAASFLLSGAALGFLPFNYPRASAFLGDAGSHLLGYALAVLTLLAAVPGSASPISRPAVAPLLILALPLFDLVSVVLIRRRLGRPFYVGDNNHLSHRLVRRGLSPAQAVLLIWMLAGSTGCIIFLL